MPLKQNALHEAVLVHCPPEPVTDTANGGTNFIYVPPGTPTRFPVTQLFSNEGSKSSSPLAGRLMADLNAMLVQYFLHVPRAQWKTVVETHRVLDDDHRESEAGGLGVGHGGSASSDSVKAT